MHSAGLRSAEQEESLENATRLVQNYLRACSIFELVLKTTLIHI